MKVRRRFAAFAVAALGAAGSSITTPSCAEQEGCLSGDDRRCVPQTPCAALRFTCDDARLELATISDASSRPPGLDALAARGDVVLANSRVVAVIDALASPHYLAPSGGNLLDLAPRGSDGGTGSDDLNHVFHATGILPADAVRYHALEHIDSSPELVAVIVRGVLDGRPDTTVVTRYEVRPCEPGVRVRTELFHGGRDPETLFASDAFYWGDREITPFVPIVGGGFSHPKLDLLEIGSAFRTLPWMGAVAHGERASAYAVVACDAPSFEAFQSESISAAGPAPRVFSRGDSIAFERFIAVGVGPGLAAAANVAHEVREQLFDEPTALVRGRVVSPDGEPLAADERLASFVINDTTTPLVTVPISAMVPGAEGRFELRLPRGRRFSVERHVLGAPLSEANLEFSTESGDVDLGDVVLPAAGVVEVAVTSDGDEGARFAEIVLVPTGSTDADAVRGSVHGRHRVDACAPYLGPPHGGSPACNRVLTDGNGYARFAAPAGSYEVFSARGPFSTLARGFVDVVPGNVTRLSLHVRALEGLVPEGALSADLHVHAGASFDSSLPEIDRARSFIASGVDVVVATDHDVVTTYESALRELGIAGKVIVLPGVETTGHILFDRPPGSSIPQVVGHYNFWPLRADASSPRNGAPWDELVEPGALFDRMVPHYDGSGVAQLNHPYAGRTFGRDEGYFSAIGYDPRDPVPDEPLPTAAGQLRRRPAGGRANIDHDVQEVMNGHKVKGFLNYRAGYHSFLSQGILKGGTANSDSHTLAEGVLGWPRTLVLGAHRGGAFDREAFNAFVRQGRMIGTNGPVIEACLTGDDGACHGPSLTPVRVSGAFDLKLEIRAAPWIPIEEVRVIVNGSLVHRIGTDALTHPKDPFGSAGVLRFAGTLSGEELLAAAGGTSENGGEDAWVIIEAGLPLWFAADLDDDGLVDTTDNDGDGVIDYLDQVGRDEDEYFVEPTIRGPHDPRRYVHAIAPGTWPTAFTNPFLVDRGESGWKAPGIK